MLPAEGADLLWEAEGHLYGSEHPAGRAYQAKERRRRPLLPMRWLGCWGRRLSGLGMGDLSKFDHLFSVFCKMPIIIYFPEDKWTIHGGTSSLILSSKLLGLGAICIVLQIASQFDNLTSKRIFEFIKTLTFQSMSNINVLITAKDVFSDVRQSYRCIFDVFKGYKWWGFKSGKLTR